MITPHFIFDSHEKWFPVSVETLIQVGAKVSGQVVTDVSLLDKGQDMRIDFPKDMIQPSNDSPVGYRRVIPAGGLWWHQHWLFYLYNPKKYAGFGEHEGDWEMVQLGCVDEVGDKPILMTCSQHQGGERREFWRVELNNARPVVYVARDSHAHYFNVHQDVTDQADGKGQYLDIEWREFGVWREWMGKWGNSDNSPGPLTTRRVWDAPHAYHSQARG